MFQTFQYDYGWVEKYIKRQKEKNRLAFAIMHNGLPVGEILLKDIDKKKRTCTLSIHLQNDTVKGKGVGAKAERLIVDYAFWQLEMKTIYADCVLKNTRSQHVLEKVGFEKIRTDDMFIYYKIDSR